MVSTFSDLIKQNTTTQEFRKKSIVDFAESPMGLNQKLFPAQKFFLKVLNKEELNNTVAEIVVKHPIEAGDTMRFTEVDYYDFLYENNRINLSIDEYRSTDIIEYLLPWGRRGTKSTIISIVNAYELDELIRIPSPQKYFGIAEEDRMSITYIGLGKDSAEKLFAKSAKVISSVRSLKRHIPERPTNSKLKIFTKADLEQERRDERGYRIHSIELAAHANSPGLRGDNNFTYVCEEFAHFNIGYKSTKEQPLDEAIYDALSPSASAFVHPSYERQVELHAMDRNYPEPSEELANRPYGKGYIISSPLRNRGKFFDMCSDALEQGAESGKLLVNIPTWEINPKVSKIFYISKWRDNPSTFDREYGALFTKGGTSWFKKLGLFYRAFDNRLEPRKARGNPDLLYFAGLDFALAGDGCAIALTAYDPNYSDLPPSEEDELGSNHPLLARYREDDEDEIQNYVPKKGRFIAAHANTFYPEEGKTLMFDNVLSWISSIVGNYRVFGGIFDQWSGDMIQQQLDTIPSLRNIKKVNFGESLNSDIANTFMSMLYGDQYRLPIDEEVEDVLLGLKEEVRKKNIIKVEVPAHEGHDDIYDALARSLYLAKAYHDKNKAILEYLLGEKIAAQAESRVIVKVGGNNPYRQAGATAESVRRRMLGLPSTSSRRHRR